jgi:hypothetical protein
MPGKPARLFLRFTDDSAAVFSFHACLAGQEPKKRKVWFEDHLIAFYQNEQTLYFLKYPKDGSTARIMAIPALSGSPSYKKVNIDHPFTKVNICQVNTTGVPRFLLILHDGGKESISMLLFFEKKHLSGEIPLEHFTAMDLPTQYGDRFWRVLTVDGKWKLFDLGKQDIGKVTLPVDDTDDVMAIDPVHVLPLSTGPQFYYQLRLNKTTWLQLKIYKDIDIPTPPLIGRNGR